MPSREPIDGRLLLGAVLFGIGWGITGFCPGPGLVSIPLLATGTMVFVPPCSEALCSLAPCARRSPHRHEGARRYLQSWAKCRAWRKRRLSMRDAFSRKSNIDIAFSSLLNLPHPA